LALSISLTGIVDLQAAPQASPILAVTAQNVDYIPADMAPALNLGFPVLVPSWVPSPFGGQPSIDAGGGYYGLYWMNAGGEPTFLHVTGQAGGSLPVGSPYDLNNELFINASVMGYDAVHDVTPAYDAVWWIAGGVLYKVESRNSGTDSLTLANSLIAFEGPSIPEPEPTEAPEPEPTDPPEPEPTVATEPEPTFVPDSEPTLAPEVEEPVDVPETEAPPVSEEPTTIVGDESTQPGSETAVEGAEDIPAETLEVETEDPEVVPVDQAGNTLSTDGTGQSSVSSDGTGGPDIPAVDGDGTGGAADVNVPRRSTGSQTP
jgi:hypothetical protein